MHIYLFYFFFNDTATTEIYTLSLHDALPISPPWTPSSPICASRVWTRRRRSEEHTSELQSPVHLVCRLLLEKKKQNTCNKTKTNKKRNNKEQHKTPSMN